MADIPVHAKDALGPLVLATLIASQKAVENRVSTALETLVLHTLPKVLSTQEFLRQFSDAVIDNSGLITPVAVLVRSKQRKIAAEQAKIGDRCRRLVEVEIKADPAQFR